MFIQTTIVIKSCDNKKKISTIEIKIKLKNAHKKKYQKHVKDDEKRELFKSYLFELFVSLLEILVNLVKSEIG